MKLISFRSDDGACYGVATPTGAIPVPDVFRSRFPTLRDVIAAEALAELEREIAESSTAVIPIEQVELLPPIPDPEKIICIGKNYGAHAAESGDVPTENPNLFIRLTNTLVPHGGALLKPSVSDHFDYEGELAAVIGKRGRRIGPLEGLSYVAGYACFNDGSVRDYQFNHSLTAGKNFLSTAGFGPWLTSADEIADPSFLHISTRLNGEEVQRGNTRDMIFNVAAIISYISAFTELMPGDIIATGTPEGVGFARKPPLWLQPGDVVEVQIEQVGILRNIVEQETLWDDRLPSSGPGASVL